MNSQTYKTLMAYLVVALLAVAALIVPTIAANAQEEASATLSFTALAVDENLTDQMLAPVIVLAAIATAFGGAIVAYFLAIKGMNYLKKLAMQK